MSPRVVDKESKREMIKRAALKVFSDKGIEASTMLEIAEQAGVGKGTLYEYFPSKQDLYLGSLEMIMDDLENHLTTRLERAADPVKKITIFLDETYRFFIIKPEISKLLCDMWTAGATRVDDKPLLAALTPRYLEFQKWLAAIIDEAVEQKLFKPVVSMHVASILMAVIDGLALQAVVGMLPKDSSRFVETICNTFLNGLRK